MLEQIDYKTIFTILKKFQRYQEVPTTMRKSAIIWYSLQKNAE